MSDAPPSYEAATGSSQASASNAETRNGIPPHIRRSMEDEARPLPEGWVRQFDEKSHHQFFVDTKANPPRSIWHHPYDDEQYLSTLSSEERERVEGLHGLLRVPTQADIAAESSDDDHGEHHDSKGTSAGKKPQQHPEQLPPRPAAQEKRTFGRRLKDKVTNTTHEQREAERRRRAEEEARAYEMHQALRRAMLEARRTGKPQYLGKGRDGKDVYIEPPFDPTSSAYPPGVYRRGAYGNTYNPYAQGPYTTPTATYIRPADPYHRPYGYGYGGGLGLPLLGGLAGGLLLGSIF